MMIPRQTPLTGTSAAVLDKRKREGGRAEPTETVALAADRRDLPARRRGAGVTAGRAVKELAACSDVWMQHETKSAALAGRKCEAARCREIGLLARQLGHDRACRTAFEGFFHGPQGIAGTRHPQDDEALHGQAHEIEPWPIKGALLGRGEIRLDPHRLASTATQRPRDQRHG